MSCMATIIGVLTQKSADYYCTSTLSTRAVRGVAHGHQVKVKTWYDAASRYNSLWDKGLVIRVPL